MRTPQELREVIIELLDNKGTNTHRMLKACGFNTSLVNDMKKGQMPSADKLAVIAKFLGVTSEFLLNIDIDMDNDITDDADAGGTLDFSADADLIEQLRRELYGSPEVRLKKKHKRAILDMARTLKQLTDGE